MRTPYSAPFWCIVVVLSTASVVPARSQEQPPSDLAQKDPLWHAHPVRDAKALAVVEASLQAMGGAGVIGNVQSYLVHAEFAVSADGASTRSGNMSWTVSGKEIRFDYPSKDGQTTLATGHGNPFRSDNGTVKEASYNVTRPLFVPALVASLLFGQLQDPNYSIEYADTGEHNARAVTIVKTSSQTTRLDAQLTPQTWYFDSETKLPLRVEYKLSDEKFSSRQGDAAVDLSDFRAMGGVLFPMQAARWFNQRPIGVLKVTSIEPNAAVLPSVFDAPAGGER